MQSGCSSARVETFSDKGLCNNYQEVGAEKLELSSQNLDSTPSPKQEKLILNPLCYVKNNVTPPPPPTTHTDLDKAFAKYRSAYHIGSKSKTSEARKRKEQRKKSKNRGLNASNNRRNRACIIFRSIGGEPDELFLSQIYMEFSKSIQSMKKHYFYSHQKPTKLVYEICLIPIVLWGKLKTSS